MSDQPMTKADRDQLIRLVRARARQAKAETEQRQAVLLVEIEQELTAEYSARDQLWEQAVQIAEQAVEKANAEIQAACLDLGIPAKHAPRLGLGWSSRSPSYMDRDRRAELRKLALTRLAALTKTAKVEIDSKALDVETTLIAGGLESDEARDLLAALPTPDQLMPALSLDDLGVKHWQPAEGAAHELMAPVTTTDRKRRRILRAIEANPGASDRKIAEIAGCDHKTVATYRRDRGELPASFGEFPADDGGAS